MTDLAVSISSFRRWSFAPRLERPIRILLVEDDDVDAMRFSRALGGDGGEGVYMLREPTVERALSILEHYSPDVCVIDYQLCGSTALDVLSALRARGDAIPGIVMAGDCTNDVARDSLRAGAADVLGKESADAPRLHRAFRAALLHRDLLATLRTPGRRDSKTKLYNRRGFLDRAAYELRRSGRARTVLLILLSVPFSTPGASNACDDGPVTCALALLVQRAVRASDIVGRLDGGEIAILALDADLLSARSICRRVARSLDGELLRRSGVRISAHTAQMMPGESVTDLLCEVLPS